MVSVVIPTYNRSGFVLEAVDSILKQDYRDFEIVVVDDGSTDDTQERLASFQAALPEEQARRMKFLKQANAGAPTARNFGFESSKGEMIVFMDSDDLLTRDGLGRVIDALEKNPQANYAYARVQRCDEAGKAREGDFVGFRSADAPGDIAGYHWQTMGAVYRRALVEKTGPWHPALKGSQDWEYQARIKMAGGPGVFVADAVVGLWRTHDQGRIGALSYNEKYVASVEKACLSIAEVAERGGFLDAKLRSKLVRRLALHALEAGAAGAGAARKRIFSSAIKLSRGVEKLILLGFSIVGIPKLDAALWNRLVGA